MTPNKVCALLWRDGVRGREMLAFQHPLAGKQLVKGTIEPGEQPQAAVLRELAEESGIRDARIAHSLGSWDSGYLDQVWAFFEIECAAPLPSSWRHFTEDDGGHLFEFFWHPLDADFGPDWHPVWRNAIAFLRQAR